MRSVAAIWDTVAPAFPEAADEATIYQRAIERYHRSCGRPTRRCHGQLRPLLADLLRRAA
jgi:hypothetical protein